VIGGVLGFEESVRAAELHVGLGQTYSTISSAIDVSNPGDTMKQPPANILQLQTQLMMIFQTLFHPPTQQLILKQF